MLLFAQRWRRARIDSPVEYLEARYGPVLRQLFAWQGVPVKVIDDGIKLAAIGAFVAVCLELPRVEALAGLGLAEPARYTMVAAGVIMLLYTLLGGLWAVAVTDFIQFVVLTAALLVVLPLSLARAGGVGAFVENMPAGFLRLTAPEYGWDYVTFLVVLYCLAWSSVNWPLIQRYYCVPREKDARKVGWLVVALYVIGPPLMFLPALAAQQFLPGIPDKEVYARLCITLLPAGMLGLVVAAMFAATMSMLSSDYNVCAGVLTGDVYRRLFRPRASQRELVLVGRLMTLLVGGVALWVAYRMSMGSGEDLFRTMVTLFSVATAPVAVPMLLGLLSRRVTNAGALAGFFCGLGVGLGLFALTRVDREVVALGVRWDLGAKEFVLGAMRWKAESVLFVCSAAVTLATTLAVSAFRSMGADERARVQAFHARLATPIGELPEDRDAGAGSARMSPFRIVGASVFLTGVLLAAMLPWVTGALALGLNAGISALLVITGAVMYRRSRRPAPDEWTDGSSAD